MGLAAKKPLKVHLNALFSVHVFRKCTSLKSLRLLEFSIFFDGDFGSESETKFSGYMTISIFDFFF